jgi:hypothetical protein
VVDSPCDQNHYYYDGLRLKVRPVVSVRSLPAPDPLFDTGGEMTLVDSPSIVMQCQRCDMGGILGFILPDMRQMSTLTERHLCGK